MDQLVKDFTFIHIHIHISTYCQQIPIESVKKKNNRFDCLPVNRI